MSPFPERKHGCCNVTPVLPYTARQGGLPPITSAESILALWHSPVGSHYPQSSIKKQGTTLHVPRMFSGGVFQDIKGDGRTPF